MSINPDTPADKPEIGMLHEHHEAQDELIWPVLLPRIAPESDLIATMEKQHGAIAEAVESIAAGLPARSALARPQSPRSAARHEKRVPRLSES